MLKSASYNILCFICLLRKIKIHRRLKFEQKQHNLCKNCLTFSLAFHISLRRKNATNEAGSDSNTSNAYPKSTWLKSQPGHALYFIVLYLFSIQTSQEGYRTCHGLSTFKPTTKLHNGIIQRYQI
jgi:hypothetical protein